MEEEVQAVQEQSFAFEMAGFVGSRDSLGQFPRKRT